MCESHHCSRLNVSRCNGNLITHTRVLTSQLVCCQQIPLCVILIDHPRWHSSQGESLMNLNLKCKQRIIIFRLTETSGNDPKCLFQGNFRKITGYLPTKPCSSFGTGSAGSKLAPDPLEFLYFTIFQQQQQILDSKILYKISKVKNKKDETRNLNAATA